MEPRTIVALEIASSKIKGAAGTVGSDGRLTVLAIEERPGINNVRYGRVQNIREVSAAANDIIAALEASPAIAPGRIKSMAVALGGRSLAASPAKAALRFPQECEVAEQHVKRLMFEATRDFMGDKNIEATLPRKFFVNNLAVDKAVGTFGETLRGEFMMVTCAKETRAALERLKYDTIDHDDIEYILRPTAIADLVLTADERTLGAALVDFGAETTTVSVYKDGTLAFLCTIPMGSRLITLDLKTGLGVTEDTAEGYKLTVGTLADGNDGGDDNTREINAYVRARAGEIAANIVNQLELAGYNADNLSQLVLTGGGSKLPEFATLLNAQCKIPVRVAEMPGTVAFRVAGRNNADNIDIVALLSAAARSFDHSCTFVPADEAANDTTDTDAPLHEVFVNDDNIAVKDTDDNDIISVQNQKATAKKTTPAYDDDDDDSILNDDDDPEEDIAAEKTPGHTKESKPRSFFAFGKRSKNNRRDDYDEYADDFGDSADSDAGTEEPIDDVFAEKDGARRHDEPYDDEAYGNKDDHFEGTKIAIDNFRKKFVKLFQSPEDDDDDE